MTHLILKSPVDRKKLDSIPGGRSWSGMYDQSAKEIHPREIEAK
jgi:hypothetical protein